MYEDLFIAAGDHTNGPSSAGGMFIRPGYWWSETSISSLSFVEPSLSWPGPVTELQLSPNFLKGNLFLLGHFYASQLSSTYWWSGYLPPLIESLTLSGLSLKPLREFGCCRKICHPSQSLACGAVASLQWDVALYPKGTAHLTAPSVFTGPNMVAHTLP
jgi:hypothetical protein